jgi:hypothetical protein
MIVIHVLNGKQFQDIEATVVVNTQADCDQFISKCRRADVYEQFSYQTRVIDDKDDVLNLIESAEE